MALKVLITAIDTNNTAKSFGIVGSVMLNANDIKRNIAKPANDDAVSHQKPELNSKKLVAVIDQLSIMDNLFKHKLNNQKIAYQNSKLNERENQIERQSQFDQLKKNDAERVKSSGNGLGLGLLGLAGLGLLAYDPILGAIKSMADFALDVGKFIGDVVTSVTDFVKGFLPDAPEEDEELPKDSSGKPIETPKPLREQAEQGPSFSPPPKQDAQPAPKPEAKPKRSLREQAEQATPLSSPAKQPTGQKDDRSWWERNAPSWAGGKPEPAPQAKPKDEKPKSSEDPSQYMDFRSPSGTRERYELLNPDVKKALYAAAKEYYQTHGEKLGIESAVRTNADQQRLWNKSVEQGHPGRIRWQSGVWTPVARPGTSPHEKKNAVDIVQWSKARNILNRHGLFQTVPGDAPHYSLGKGSATPVTNQDQPKSSASKIKQEEQQSTTEKIIKQAEKAVDKTLINIAEFIGTVGAHVVGPGVARDLTTAAPNFAQLISNEAAVQTAEIAKIKEDANKPEPVKLPTPPNINPSGSGVVENLPTMVDRNSIEYYLSRFGYKETNKPIKAT